MSCLLCASSNHAEFGTEILIHFSGITNLEKPPVWAFPRLLVCLDCGFSQFTTPERELAPLAKGTAASETSTPDDVALRRRIAV
jgi:hypothetical protein